MMLLFVFARGKNGANRAWVRVKLSISSPGLVRSTARPIGHQFTDLRKTVVERASR